MNPVMARGNNKLNEHWTQKRGRLVAKIQFRSLSDCLDNMDKAGIDKVKYHPYVCSICGAWHIGHHHQHKKKSKDASNMASTWISVTKELPQTDEEVLVKVERPFSKHAVAKYDHSLKSWLQYMCPINDPAIKFAGGWIAFDKGDVITHWKKIDE